jgi:hypothetical protein
LVNQQITPDGFSIISEVIEPAQCQQLIELLGAEPGAGRRGLLAIPAVAALARSERILDLIRPHLAGPPVPVRSIYFDKSPTANWLVPWHQDLTLALAEQAHVPGFGPWSHSARSTAQAHRRILHIEYAGFTLPDTLRWHENA